MASSKETSADHCEIGIIAFDALVQPNVDCVHGIHHRGGASHQQIRQSWRGAGRDDGDAIFFLKSLIETKLLGLERIAHEVRAQVDVMRADAQGGSEDNFIEDGGAEAFTSNCDPFAARTMPHRFRAFT